MIGQSDDEGGHVGVRQPVTADDLDRAVQLVVETLGKGDGQDWSVPAGDLEWTCRDTAAHVAGCLMSYASLLAVRARERWLGYRPAIGDGTTPAAMLEFILAGGQVLATVVRASGPKVRAFHPYGTSDPEGFAGMACVEVLVHGHDIAGGLGLTLDPPADLCARVVARMFPDVAADTPGIDPWKLLRYATGRVTLPGRPRVAPDWRWRGAPLAD